MKPYGNGLKASGKGNKSRPDRNKKMRRSPKKPLRKKINNLNYLNLTNHDFFH